MPYEIKGKCVYKKTGKKVGCSDNPKQYLKALYANTNESIEEILDEVNEYFKNNQDSDYLKYDDHPLSSVDNLLDDDVPAPWDEEYEKPVGTEISEDRVNSCFQADIYTTIDECKKLYPNFLDLPEEVQLILCNMMFNMGRPRLSNFKKMNAAIAEGDWMEASIQMEDSRWAKQVPNRANRLIKRMEDVAVKEQIAT